MLIKDNLNNKSIFRITGTPENFLTALRNGVWGFNEKNKKGWEKLNSGDIIFFHSKGGDSFFLQNPIPSIIGFGVVGDYFYEDADKLWIDEFINNSTYQYRFTFSEFYFYADIPLDESWDSTSLKKRDNTSNIINNLLSNSIPLSHLEGFPHMGSYSSIQNLDVKSKLLRSDKPLFCFKGLTGGETSSKPAEFSLLTSVNESLRFSTSLTIFDDVTQRIIKKGNRTYSVNTDLLAKAEKSHYQIIKDVHTQLQENGFDTYFNNHVDLFACKADTSILIEAKSIENRNFKSQSRKGIVQLFEYNFFEVQKFKIDQQLSKMDTHKLLVTSAIPYDKDYVGFINSLGICTASVNKSRLKSYGTHIDFDTLLQ